MTCRHPGFVSQTYRRAYERLPDGSPGRSDTYWTEPRCARCGRSQRSVSAEPRWDAPWLEVATFGAFVVVVLVLLALL